MFQMSTGQKYLRTNFDDDENASAAEDGTPTGTVYNPVMSFRTQGTFCQRRTGLEKVLFSVVLVLTVSTFVLVVLYSKQKYHLTDSGVASSTHQLGNPSADDPPLTAAIKSRPTKSGGTCTSKKCITAASSILNSMDESVDPCEDFYQYSCGGWMRAHPIPAGEPRWDSFGAMRKENHIALKNAFESPLSESLSEAEQKAKIYFLSCMDPNRTLEKLDSRPLIDLMNSLGGWMISRKTATLNSTLWNFEESLAASHGLGVFPFFNLWVNEDEKRPTENILQIDQSGLMLETDQYKNKTEHDEKVLEAYLKYMTDIGVLVGGERSKTREQMEKVITFERIIANVTMPMDERDIGKMYNKMTVKELQTLAPFINWKQYLNRMLSVSSYQVNDTEMLLVKQPTYMRNISSIVQTMSGTVEGREILHNYMMWHIANTFAFYLSKPFREARKEFNQILFGTKGEEELWRTCVGETENVLGFAAGAMFVREMFTDDSKQMAESMIGYVADAFKQNLHHLQWMDKETMTVASEKADAMIGMIGYPDYILNATMLDERYRELKVDIDKLLTNTVNSMRFTVKLSLDQLRKVPEKSRWIMHPSAVNAYYSSVTNQIVFPAGILQPPFFDREYPNSLNFGSIGVVMGHELTHGFDDQGRQYDKHGILRPWWNNDSVSRFTQQTQCMVDQYSEYEEHGEKIKGKQTLGENIADNGGLKSAFYAYNIWAREHDPEPMLPGLNFTHQQLFFLAYAQIWCTNVHPEDYRVAILSDSHSPHKYRVIGALANSKEFAELFRCKQGTAMNPARKCEVW